MGRALRNAQPGAIHHVVNRGNRRAVIFHKPGDYDAFVQLLGEACGKFAMRLIAFCVMPNHWHLILWPSEDVSLSAFMQWLTSTHVRRYHAHYELVGTGHLYQARYRNHICRDERRLLATIRYVEANPLKAGLVRRARDWKWSSLSMRLTSGENDFLTPCPIELPRNWADYVDLTTKVRSNRREKQEEADDGATSAESSAEVLQP
jgi:putative transposase